MTQSSMDYGKHEKTQHALEGLGSAAFAAAKAARISERDNKVYNIFLKKKEKKKRS